VGHVRFVTPRARVLRAGGKSVAARRAYGASGTTHEEVIMSTVPAVLRPVPVPSTEALRRDPVAQASLLMRAVFTVAPILFGLDKFAHVLTDNWTRYLSSEFNDIIPGTASQAMHMVGVVEILAGLIVLVAPRIGGLIVAAWLGGIILNLLLVGGYGDIALRDLGLLAGAVAMSRLASAPPRER
jgi:hypothetical protein